jgi:aminoglycoside phosphotransferase (APT) family kinase protein
MLETPHAPACLYENEVRFYATIRPELAIEAPAVVGATFDRESGHFAVLMEDLSVRGATFPNATTADSVPRLSRALQTLAQLHGVYWQSPRFELDLAWVQSHLSGSLWEFFDGSLQDLVESEVRDNPFKAACVERLRHQPAELCRLLKVVQRHQARLPRTLLHGDSHVGNTYRLPGGAVGLLDWQLMVRGCWAHDFAYQVGTSLPIDARRRHEAELLREYLDALARHGVTEPPSFDDAWTEYRRALVWTIIVGWMPVPNRNYSQKICMENLNRLITASEDLDTFRLVDAM